MFKFFVLLAALLVLNVSVVYADGQPGDDHTETDATHMNDTTSTDHHDDDDGHHDDGDDHNDSNMEHEHDAAGNLSDYVADVAYTLSAELRDGKMVFVGVGGDIDGLINPTLMADHGAVVEITLVNASPLEHDLAFPDLQAYSDHTLEGEETTFAFKAAEIDGSVAYICTILGHREAGMEGLIHFAESH